MRKHLIVTLSAVPLVLGGITVSSAEAVGDAPRWPGGCDSHSMLFLDYTAEAKGFPTHRKAARKWMLADDTLVKQPGGPHERKHWLVVKPNNRIRASLTMFQQNGGYLVDSVEKCAR
jgi:hypothetical protein